MDFIKLKSNLERKGYKVSLLDNEQAAIEYLAASIRGMSVGFGGSQTLTSLDLHHILAKNNRVFVPDFPPEGETFDSMAVKAMNTDVYLLSANAITVLWETPTPATGTAKSVFWPRKASIS